MSYNKEDFDKCLFNPMGDIPNERIEAITSDKELLCYIVFAYDPFSPVVKKYPEIEKRKKEAVRLSGYAGNLDSLMDCSDDKVAVAIIEYLKIVNSRDWAMIVSLEQSIWEHNLRLMQPIEKGDKGDKDLVSAVKIKGDLVTNLKEFNAELDFRINKFYTSDDKLIESHKAEDIKYSAEGIAHVLKNKGR